MMNSPAIVHTCRVGTLQNGLNCGPCLAFSSHVLMYLEFLLKFHIPKKTKRDKKGKHAATKWTMYDVWQNERMNVLCAFLRSFWMIWTVPNCQASRAYTHRQANWWTERNRKTKRGRRKKKRQSIALHIRHIKLAPLFSLNHLNLFFLYLILDFSVFVHSKTNPNKRIDYTNIPPKSKLSIPWCTIHHQNWIVTWSVLSVYGIFGDAKWAQR